MRASIAFRDASAARTEKNGLLHARFTDGWSDRESTHWPGAGGGPGCGSTAAASRASEGGGGRSGRRLLSGVSESPVDGRDGFTCADEVVD